MAGRRPAHAAYRDRDVGSFDRRARSYEGDWRSEFHARVVAGAAEVVLAALPHPAAVLDVGCGTGALLRTLPDRLPAAARLQPRWEPVAGRDRGGQLGAGAEGDHELLVGRQGQGGGVAPVGAAVDVHP